MTPAEHARAIRGLILRYGTPAEGLGRGDSFRLRPAGDARDDAAGRSRVGAVTIAVQIETQIGRSPADVFAELTAVERFPEWLIASGIVRVERLDEGPLAVGTRLRIGQSVGGRSTVLDGAVTVVEPGSAFGLRGRDPDGVTIELDARLSSEDGLTTRMRWSLRMGLPLRYRMFESMVAPQAKRAATLDLEAVQTAAGVGGRALNA